VLEELHVAGLALVDDVWLELDDGLTVLTGETGAGKTVLVGALKLLLGERADASMVRSGASEGVVEGRFALPDGERTAKRRLSPEGRSRCYLDGEMSTVRDLADTLGPLVDLHGQHEHQALLTPARHAAYLDRFAGRGAAGARAGWIDAFDAVAEARAALEDLETALGDRERELDYLRFQTAEIDAASIRAGEDEEIEAALPRMRHGERLTEAASRAYAALRGEGGASDRTAEALSALHGVEGIDPGLDEAAAELLGAQAAVDDLGARLRDYGEAVEYDPQALNAAEARLAALATLKKKYGPGLEEVAAARQAAAARVELLEAGEAGLDRARAALESGRARLADAGRALTAVREEAAPRFTAALAEAAADLALEGARFDVSLEALPEERWTREGPQRVEFLFSPAPGEPPRDLARIASGGEVSRVMLALKGVLGQADDVRILVFDEVDAGIGGRTAVAVGRRLAQLARDHQVLAVTHLAQVAAFADAHLSVTKVERGGRTVTEVTPVTGEARIAEVARMLAGGDSETSLAHARELIAESAPERGV
jgi:DNA repair protein RecN (Recombination protein N)